MLSTRRHRTTVLQVTSLTTVSKWRSLLLVEDDDEMFMTRSLNLRSKTTEQHLIACSDKSVAYVTNIKRLCSTFRTIEANYRKTQSISRPLCNSRATCISIQLCHSFRYRFYEVPSPQLCNCSTIILTFVVAVVVVVAVAAAAAAAGKGRKYNI